MTSTTTTSECGPFRPYFLNGTGRRRLEGMRVQIHFLNVSGHHVRIGPDIGDRAPRGLSCCCGGGGGGRRHGSFQL